MPWWVSLRQGTYTYIRTLVEGETEVLNDLSTDPEEPTNLTLGPKHRDRVLTLRPSRNSGAPTLGWSTTYLQ